MLGKNPTGIKNYKEDLTKCLEYNELEEFKINY